MAGIGQNDITPLAAGSSAQPIVSPFEPVVTPDSVKALVDAVHSGAISAIDISNRIGAEAQATKRAHIQQLSEYVRPEAIQSRMDQIKAAGAQAQLAGASAEAQQPLVGPRADLESMQIASNRATTVYGKGGLDAVQSIGPWYGVSMEQFTKPDGTVDFAKASQKGNELAAQQSIITNWYNQLSPVATKEVIDTSGVKHIAQLNAAGADVSKPAQQSDGTMYPGSPLYWHIVDQLNDVMPKTHPLRGVVPAVHPGDREAAVSPGVPVSATSTGPARTVVVASNEPRFRAEYAEELKGRGIENPEKEALRLPVESIQAWVDNKYPAGAQPQIVAQSAPVAAAAAPVVAPAGFGTPVAGGPAVAPAQTPVQMREEVQKAQAALSGLPDVNEYYKAVPTFIKFADSAKRAPIARNGATDLGLAENYSKMHDPQSTIREFKFEALREVIPLLDRFKDAAALINKSHIFPDNVRQAIIEDGTKLMDATEAGIRPRLIAAEKNLPGTLDDEQRAIVKGIPLSVRQGLGATTAAAPTTLTELPSGRRVRFVPVP